MNPISHPVEPEEVMAYCDGELPPEREAIVSEHLQQCSECRVLAGELNMVSQQMASWTVEPSPSRLATRLEGAQPVRRPPLVRAWIWQAAVVMVGLVLVFAIATPNLLRSRGGVSHWSEPGVIGVVAPPSTPMIARTADLSILAKEFANARSTIEDIVRKHQGYIAHLQVEGQHGSAKSLSVTVRLPAERLDAAMLEMKRLGVVAQESQTGEEVTQQYVDLVARLSNARNTEQRLVEVLKQRTGKVSDVLAVEKEIARVREEIERLDAQRQNMEKRVLLATLNVRLTEEYRAEIQAAPPTSVTRLWNAMVEGYHGAVESAMDLAEFTLRHGPTLGFWLMVLFLPARLVWRRLPNRSPVPTPRSR